MFINIPPSNNPKPCPTCGRCPTCGNGGHGWPYSNQPWWQTPSGPTWGGITGSTSGGSQATTNTTAS